MPRFATGNMFSVLGNRDAIILVTANSTLDKDGHLVMGAGAAYELTKRYPRIEISFGRHVRNQMDQQGQYGLLLHPEHPCGLFQTKTDFHLNAIPSVIQFSVSRLAALCNQCSPRLRFHLNFPGIGLGRLYREDVLPWLAPLPDTVTIWEFEKSPLKGTQRQ